VLFKERGKTSFVVTAALETNSVDGDEVYFPNYFWCLKH